MASRRLLALPVIVAALALGACGSEGIQLSEDDPNYEGAVLFDENCAECHSLDVVGAQGSATNVGSRERRDGPNFNERQETSRTCSTRSATAASRRRRCRRTS